MHVYLESGRIEIAEIPPICLFGRIIFYCGGKPLQSSLQNGPGSTHVKAHESLSAGAESLTVIKRQACLVHEQVYESLMVQAQFAAVKPYQESSLRTHRFDGRDMLLEVILYKTHVILYITDELAAPLLTLAECGNDCNQRALQVSQRRILFPGCAFCS